MGVTIPSNFKRLGRDPLAAPNPPSGGGSMAAFRGRSTRDTVPGPPLPFEPVPRAPGQGPAVKVLAKRPPVYPLPARSWIPLESSMPPIVSV